MPCPICTASALAATVTRSAIAIGLLNEMRKPMTSPPKKQKKKPQRVKTGKRQ